MNILMAEDVQGDERDLVSVASIHGTRYLKNPECGNHIERKEAFFRWFVDTLRTHSASSVFHQLTPHSTLVANDECELEEAALIERIWIALYLTGSYEENLDALVRKNKALFPSWDFNQDGKTHINLLGPSSFAKELKDWLAFNTPSPMPYSDYVNAAKGEIGGLLSYKEYSEREDGQFTQRHKQAVFELISKPGELSDKIKANSLPYATYWKVKNRWKLENGESGIVHAYDQRWLENYMNTVTAYHRGEAHRLLILGSKHTPVIEDTFDDFIHVEKSFRALKHPAVSIVTGKETGTDCLAKALAEHYQLPLSLLDLKGEIAVPEDSYDAALIFWNGVSQKTSAIINLIKATGKPLTVVSTELPWSSPK